MIKLLFIFFLSFCETLYDSLKVPVECNEEYCYPKVVWSYWKDETAPEDVEEMIAVTKKSLEIVNIRHILVTADNASDFLNLDQTPIILGILQVQIQADYVRVSLLERYGGIYTDSTMYVTSGKAVNKLISQALSVKCGIFGFEKCWSGKFLIENCFIGAPKESLFMWKFKTEFDKVLSGSPDRYIRESCAYMKEKTPYGALFWGCNKPYFLMDHIFLMLSEKEGLRSHMMVLPWQEGPFALDVECNLDTECFNRLLRNDSATRRRPFIKVNLTFRNGKKWNIKTVEEDDDPKLTQGKYPMVDL